MSYLLDTDTCIYWLNGRRRVQNQFLRVAWSALAVSVITQVELYYGAYNSSRTAENMDRVTSFLAQISILPLTSKSIEKFAEIKTELHQLGKPLADFDLLIASTALVDERILVTNNVRHYERISELRLENWMRQK